MRSFAGSSREAERSRAAHASSGCSCGGGARSAFGSPGVTGKPNASDLREGKRTLLVARALAAASPQDAAILRAGLGKPDADVDALRAIIERSGAAKAARETAERLCEEAIRALEALPQRVAQHLREIAVYSVQRAF